MEKHLKKEMLREKKDGSNLEKKKPVYGYTGLCGSTGRRKASV